MSAKCVEKMRSQNLKERLGNLKYKARQIRDTICNVIQHTWVLYAYTNCELNEYKLEIVKFVHPSDNTNNSENICN